MWLNPPHRFVSGNSYSITLSRGQFLGGVLAFVFVQAGTNRQHPCLQVGFNRVQFIVFPPTLG
ncbi:MAG: hypothetical protein DMG58_01590 [Acidobacteria bacterium]|nr:MAG: hypothetical protein DMG58_01590 [Acidobacteriota bacterium]